MRFVALFTLIFLIIFRFINLGDMPIFIDEQTYLKLGGFSIANKDSLLLSLKYLVFPIVPWILGIFQLLFSSLFNQLYLGRLIMVIADLTSTLFIYLIGKKVLNHTYGVYCSIVYLLIPLNFFHSRIVLLEPLTNMFFLAGLYFYLGIFRFTESIKTLNSVARILGASALFTMSFLSKPLALVSFSVLPIATVFFWFNDENRNFKKILIYLSVLMVIFAFIFLLSKSLISTVWIGYSDYRISPNINLLLINLKSNLWLTWWWSKDYLSMGLIFAVFTSFACTVLIREWRVLWIFFWLAAVIFLESLVGTNFLPRHLFLICAPVALTIGFLFLKIAIHLGKVITVLLMTLIFLIPLSINSQIVANPENAPIALEDKQQFFQDWTSGVGLNSVSIQLQKISREKDIFVYVESDGGFGWALAHLYNVGNTTIIESAMLNDRSSMLYLPKEDNIYVVLNREPDPPEGWPLELVGAYPKQTERRYVKIYKYQGDHKFN